MQLTRIVGGILVVLAIAGGIASTLFPSERQRLATEGVDTKGRIVEKWQGEPRLHTTFKRSFYFIGFEFQTASGELLRDELSLWMRSQLEAARIGQEIGVRYLPSNPRIHEVIEYRDGLAARRIGWGLLLSGVLFLFGAAMLYATRERRPAEESKPETAPEAGAVPVAVVRRASTSGAGRRGQGFGTRTRTR